MIFDLHTHTDCSFDGTMSPSRIVAEARARGLDGIGITDHQNMEIRRHLDEGVQENGLVVVFGMEYATDDGDFLVFGPFENLPPRMEAPELLRRVDRDGGVAVAAHPFRTARPIRESVLREGLCRIVEGINGRNSGIENLRMETWRKKYRLPETGGSDAHTSGELGRVVTRFETPILGRKDLIAALKSGRYRPEWGAVPAEATAAG